MPFLCFDKTINWLLGDVGNYQFPIEYILEEYTP